VSELLTVLLIAQIGVAAAMVSRPLIRIAEAVERRGQ
jgi:hypothetical protein